MIVRQERSWLFARDRFLYGMTRERRVVLSKAGVGLGHVEGERALRDDLLVAILGVLDISCRGRRARTEVRCTALRRPMSVVRKELGDALEDGFGAIPIALGHPNEGHTKERLTPHVAVRVVVR